MSNQELANSPFVMRIDMQIKRHILLASPERCVQPSPGGLDQFVIQNPLTIELFIVPSIEARDYRSHHSAIPR